MGKKYELQNYKCKNCKHSFVNKNWSKKNISLYEWYADRKQTLNELSRDTGYTKQHLQRLLDKYSGSTGEVFIPDKKTCLVMDATFFGRGYGFLIASKELLSLVRILTKTTEKEFSQSLEIWYLKWKDFLKERSENFITGKQQFTHKHLRSAYFSLKRNLPYLFTYLEYPLFLHLRKVYNIQKHCLYFIFPEMFFCFWISIVVNLLYPLPISHHHSFIRIKPKNAIRVPSTPPLGILQKLNTCSASFFMLNTVFPEFKESSSSTDLMNSAFFFRDSKRYVCPAEFTSSRAFMIIFLFSLSL